MRRLLMTLAMVVMILGLTSCLRHTYTVGNGASPAGPPSYSEWHHHFVLGLIGQRNVNVSRICPTGNAFVLERISVINGVIGTLVGLIWYPTTVTVWCGGGVGQTDGDEASGETARVTDKATREL